LVGGILLASESSTIIELFDSLGNSHHLLMVDFDALSSSCEPHEAIENEAKVVPIVRTIVREGWVETVLIGIEQGFAPIRAWISRSITILSVNCFKGRGAIQSLSFESNS
jgi:hypothetical protein